MDTLPMPLDAVAAAHGGLDDFRLTSVSEIGAMLKRLLDGNVPLSLNAPDGSSLSATLWTIDGTRGHISFNPDLHDPNLATSLATAHIAGVERWLRQAATGAP